MKNRLSLILFTLIITLIFITGCTKKEPSQVDKMDTKKSTTTKSDYPITVKDSTGVELKIESKPKNIASLSLCTDEILLSLADKKNIKALSKISDDPILSSVTKEAKSISTKLESNSEKVISSNPDIVFAADWSDKAFVQQLRDAKINVYLYKTPSTVTDVKSLIQQIAQITGEKENGVKLVSWMDSKLITVDQKLKNINEAKKVKVLSIDGTFSAYGKGTSFDEICQKAKVTNVATKAGIIQWKEINKEKVIELKPDIVILPSWSYKGFDAKKNAENFRSDKSLKDVPAVKNNKVLELHDKYITSVSQNIVLGVEEVSKSAYPDLFK